MSPNIYLKGVLLAAPYTFGPSQLPLPWRRQRRLLSSTTQSGIDCTMIATLLSLSTLAWAIPTALVAFYIAVRLSLQHRLAKAPGVRAHILGDNPITSMSLHPLDLAHWHQRDNHLTQLSFQSCHTRCAYAKCKPSRRLLYLALQPNPSRVSKHH